MMQRFFTIIIILAALIMGVFSDMNCYAQSRKDLEQKRKQAQAQIQKTSKLLDETKEGKKKSYNQLLLLNKQISSRKDLISQIESEVKLLNQIISENTDSIRLLEEELEKLKASYARMIQHAYQIKSSQDRLLFILSAEDFNQAYKRLAYLKELAKYRRLQAAQIEEMKALIKQENEALENVKNDKLNLLTEKERESKNLYYEVEEQNTIISHLKNTEAELRKQLQTYKQQADNLQREIERLIAEEAKRSSSEGYKMTPEEALISKEFGNNKGRLPWPVVSGIITGRFGKQAHPVLKNVFVNNNGLDISTQKGSTVRAIFNGEVRKVFKVPGYQNAVIIRHGNYLSTYTHLEAVYVSVGDKVSTKQSIGSVHTDVNEGKTIVHIEIWHGQNVLNPEQWLAK
jgi:murein hydrolase activator